MQIYLQFYRACVFRPLAESVNSQLSLFIAMVAILSAVGCASMSERGMSMRSC